MLIECIVQIRSIISIIAIIIAAIGSYIYFKDVFSSKTKPHIFTWLIWAMIDFIGFAAQISNGAGIASFVIGANALCGLAVFILAFRQGEKNIRASDYWCFIGAIIALVFLVVTKNPLASIILVVVISLLGFMPTVRKSHLNPLEETIIYYMLMGIKATLTVIALEKFTAVTYLEPISMAFANFLFVGMLVVRRRQISTS